MMKIAAIPIVVGFLYIFGVNGGKIQERNEFCWKKNDVLIAMPGSCHYFFMCVNGYAVPNSCGPLYHFNERTGHCDHPLRANCKRDQFKTIQSDAVNVAKRLELVKIEPSKPPLILKPTKILTNDNVSPHETQPLNEKITHTGASSNTQHALIPKPQHPDEVVADLGAGPICQGHAFGELLPKPDSCSHYYVCVMERPYRRTCPPHMHFNPTKLICQDPTHAKCISKGTSSASNIKKDVHSTITIHERCANYSGLLPHPEECGKFYVCNHGKSVAMVCPEGLHFSERDRRCEWPYIAKCRVSK